MKITKYPLELAIEMSALWSFPGKKEDYLLLLAKHLIEECKRPKPVDEIISEAFSMAEKIKGC